MGKLNAARKPIFLGFDGHHGIEAQQGQVCQVVFGDAFAPPCGDDQAEAPESGGPSSRTTQLGNEDLVGISDNDLLDLTAPRDQQSELPSTLAAELAKSSSRFWIDEGVLGDASPVKALDPLGLVGLQALSVAMQFGRNGTGPWCSYSAEEGDTAPRLAKLLSSAGMSTSTPALSSSTSRTESATLPSEPGRMVSLSTWTF